MTVNVTLAVLVMVPSDALTVTVIDPPGVVIKVGTVNVADVGSDPEPIEFGVIVHETPEGQPELRVNAMVVAGLPYPFTPANNREKVAVLPAYTL